MLRGVRVGRISPGFANSPFICSFTYSRRYGSFVQPLTITLIRSGGGNDRHFGKRDVLI
jgi:hypothetical protein